MESWNERAAKSTYEIDEQSGNLIIKNAVTRYRNFSGEANKFGSTTRTFNVVITPEVASDLIEEGWHVKQKPGDDGDIINMIEVVVNMDSQWPPVITLYSEFRGKKTATNLTKEDVGDLDRKVRIKKCDVVIHPRQQTMKGYLREMRVVQQPQNGYFDDEYNDYEFAANEVEEVPFD